MTKHSMYARLEWNGQLYTLPLEADRFPRVPLAGEYLSAENMPGSVELWIVRVVWRHGGLVELALEAPDDFKNGDERLSRSGWELR